MNINLTAVHVQSFSWVSWSIVIFPVILYPMQILKNRNIFQSCHLYTYREKKRKMIRFCHYAINGLLYMHKVGRFHDQPEQVAKDKKLRLYLTSLPLEDSQWSSWHPNGLAKPRCPHRRNISAFLYLHLWILLYIVLPPIHPSSEHLLLRGLGLPFELSDLS